MMATPVYFCPMINSGNHFIVLSLFSILKLAVFAWTHKLESLGLINIEKVVGVYIYVSQWSSKLRIIWDE